MIAGMRQDGADEELEGTNRADSWERGDQLYFLKSPKFTKIYQRIF